MDKPGSRAHYPFCLAHVVSAIGFGKLCFRIGQGRGHFSPIICEPTKQQFLRNLTYSTFKKSFCAHFFNDYFTLLDRGSHQSESSADFVCAAPVAEASAAPSVSPRLIQKITSDTQEMTPSQHNNRPSSELSLLTSKSHVPRNSHVAIILLEIF